jgi:hypothetical protein
MNQSLGGRRTDIKNISISKIQNLKLKVILILFLNKFFEWE